MKRFLSAIAIAIAIALLAATALAGCAQAEPSGGAVSPSPSPSISLTGNVEHLGIEGGCTVLRVDSTNKVYELKGGDAQVLTVGAHVSVTGKIRTDLATTCQVGPVFEVISSQVS